jgi:hypothetical protein
MGPSAGAKEGVDPGGVGGGGGGKELCGGLDEGGLGVLPVGPMGGTGEGAGLVEAG